MILRGNIFKTMIDYFKVIYIKINRHISNNYKFFVLDMTSGFYILEPYKILGAILCDTGSYPG